MKWLIKICFVLIVYCSFCITPVFASTNTKDRTSENNYLVNDWVTIDRYNYNDILRTPAIDSSEKVYDFADLFSLNEEKELYKQISEYINFYDMDLAVVTINENNKHSSMTYADDFYDYNYFKDDGLLFLIDMEYREIYISTTGTAIDMYNDYRINGVLDRIYEYMTDEKYYDGLSKGIKIISEYADNGMPINVEFLDTMTLGNQILYSMVVALIITIITIFILIMKNKLVRPATTAREYLNEDSIKVNDMGDILVSSNTTRHKIEHSSSSGGGSSRHSGSSGRSHGGGGRKF